MADLVQIVSAEMKLVEDIILRSVSESDNRLRPHFQSIPYPANQISSVLNEISPLMDNTTLYHSLNEQEMISQFKASIGSTNISTSKYLVGDDAI